VPNNPAESAAEELERVRRELDAMTGSRDLLQAKYDRLALKIAGIGGALEYLSEQCKPISPKPG